MLNYFLHIVYKFYVKKILIKIKSNKCTYDKSDGWRNFLKFSFASSIACNSENDPSLSENSFNKKKLEKFYFSFYKLSFEQPMQQVL